RTSRHQRRRSSRDSAMASWAAFGCGCGLGSLFTLRAVKQRHEEQLEKAATRASSLATQLEGETVEEECQWLHSLLLILWPRIDRFLKVVVEEQVIPEIDKALPKMLKGAVSFPKVHLGQAVPHFRDICLKERSDGAIMLKVNIELASDMDVQIKAMKVPLGVRHLSLSGELNVRFHPVATAPPFFAGVGAFFIEPPKLDMDFTGAADFVDMPLIRDVVHSTIMGILNAQVVLPARIAIDLNQDDDTDQADLNFPEPLGVLRVLLRRGKDLRAADVGFTGGRSSDPYVVMEVGQARWQSPVVEKSLNPVWEHHNVADFLVYEQRQKLHFRVFDKDQYSADDLIGAAHSVLPPFMEAMSPKDFEIPLDYQGEGAGSLGVSARWLGVASRPPKAISSAVARGPSQLVLAVKLLGVTDLPKSHKPPFTVRVEVPNCGVQMISRKSTPPSNIKPVAQEVADIARRLSRSKHSTEQICEITGLEPHAVKLAVAHSSPDFAEARRESMAEMSITHPEFNQVLHLPLPWTETVAKATVSLKLIDRTEKPIGKPLVLRLADAAERPLEGGYDLSSGGTLNAKLSTLWLKVPSAS
ncbi:unnamed protein product, partial [Effrenium voratum]